MKQALQIILWGTACAIVGGMLYPRLLAYFGEITAIGCCAALVVAGMAGCMLSERS